MAQEDEDRIPGERAETVTSRQIDNSPLLKRGAVAIAIIAFVSFALWSTTGKKGRDENVQPERIIIRQTTPFEAAKEKVEPDQALPEVKLPTPVVEPVIEEQDKLLDSARRAPVMAFSGGQRNRKELREGDSSYPSDNSNFVPLDNNMSVQNQQNNEQQSFDGLLRPTRLEGSRAGTLGNRNFIVAMGTTIPCVLETALASDQPGFTTCVINRDVLSDNGRVVLMEKGTQVVGEYRGGLQRGQERLFILWNRAKTPKGVIVTLASPATDALGRAGVDGHVDTIGGSGSAALFCFPLSGTRRTMQAVGCRTAMSTRKKQRVPVNRRPPSRSSSPSISRRHSISTKVNRFRSLSLAISTFPASTVFG